MRQPDLAKTMVSLGEAAWSASTVSRAESGERSLSLSEFIALAYALGATPDELLDPTAFGDVGRSGADRADRGPGIFG